MKVNLFSENEIISSVGHGIHTVYWSQLEAMKQSVEVVKNRWFSDDCDIVHLHTYGPLAFMKAISSKKPVIVTAHTIPELLTGSISSKTLTKLFTRYLKIFYNTCDLIIAPSKTTKNRLKKLEVTKEILILSNGVNTDQFKHSKKKKTIFRKKHHIPNNQIVVYTVGSIIPRKGLYTFIKIAKKFPAIKFIWIGQPLLRRITADFQKIQKLIKNKPNNHTTKTHPQTRNILNV